MKIKTYKNSVQGLGTTNFPELMTLSDRDSSSAASEHGNRANGKKRSTTNNWEVGMTENATNGAPMEPSGSTEHRRFQSGSDRGRTLRCDRLMKTMGAAMTDDERGHVWQSYTAKEVEKQIHRGQ